MTKHFINTQDFSKAEILELIELSGMIKGACKAGAPPQLLKHRSLGMIFEEPSTRTRISFEVAMTRLGGHALYLKPGEIHLGVRESLGDTARVISRMCDAIECRALKNETMLGLAEFATVPVINGLTDYNHPTQAICDVMTMLEHKEPGKKLEDLHVTFVGDATNVCSSLLFLCTHLGMHFKQAAPKAYQSPEAWQKIARENCKTSGGSFEITDDVRGAVHDADFIYTDLWWWVGQEKEIPDREKAFMPKFQVNKKLLSEAPPHAKVMHCLPASRGVEATDEVLDGKQSIIFDQAENRLSAEMGIVTWLIYPNVKQPSEDLVRYHDGRIEAFLGKSGWDH